MRRAPLPVLVSAAIVALFSSAGAARADVAPPELNGCGRRPEGAVCYVRGVERGVCKTRPGEPRECLVIADPKDAPPPPTTPDPPASVAADPTPPADQGSARRGLCAARAPGEGTPGDAILGAALVALGFAAARRARAPRPAGVKSARR